MDNADRWLIGIFMASMCVFMFGLAGLFGTHDDRLTALETQSAQAHSGVIENASVRPVGSIEIGSGS